jgi:hypothetical protein
LKGSVVPLLFRCGGYTCKVTMSSLQGCAANLFTRGLHHQAVLSFFVFILTFESMDMQGILMHRYVCINTLMLVCNLYNVNLSLYDPPVAHPWFFLNPHCMNLYSRCL